MSAIQGLLKSIGVNGRTVGNVRYIVRVRSSEVSVKRGSTACTEYTS